MNLTLHTGAVVVLRYVVPIQHACAHACRYAMGVESAPGGMHCGEAGEWTFSMSRVGPRGGSLANAGRGVYLSGWNAHYAEHNARCNADAALWLLRQLGRTLRSLHAAIAAYEEAVAAELARARHLSDELGAKRKLELPDSSSHRCVCCW